MTFKWGSRGRESTQQLPALNISGPLSSGGRARSYAPQGHGRSNQRFSSWERREKKTLKIQQPATESLKTAVRCFLDDGRDCWRMSAGADASASEADQKLNIEGFQPFTTLGASRISQDIKPGDAFRSTGRRRELGETVQCSVCQETKRFAQHKGGFGKLNRCEYAGGQQTGKN